MGRNSHCWREIAQIAARQHGNISTEQLLTVGLGKDAIHYATRTARLHRVFRGVYAVGRPPAQPLERAAAAVLTCGPRSALSHRSAMTLWEFWKRWDRPFEITVAGDRRPGGIRIHRCSTLLRRDVTTHRGIRVTSPARTCLDMAPRLTAKALARAINDARLAKLLTPDALADVLGRNRSHPGAPLLRHHLGEGQNPTRSSHEDDFLAFCRRFGLPTPRVNTIVHGYEVDAYFEAEGVIVELDSWGFHSGRVAFEDDRERDAVMLMHGIPTVRLTWQRLHRQPQREAARLHSILQMRRAA